MTEDQQRLVPDLPDSEMELLNRLLKGAEGQSIEDILAAAELHHEQAIKAREENPLVHLDLSAKLLERCLLIKENWATIDASHQEWLKGAILYYIYTDDEDHDINSSTGFDDDLEVMNACLQFANKINWLIELEE